MAQNKDFGGTVSEDDISHVLQYYLHYNSNVSKKPQQYKAIMRKVIELYQRDYDVSILSNKNGQLCDSYPQWMILPTSALTMGRETATPTTGSDQPARRSLDSSTAPRNSGGKALQQSSSDTVSEQELRSADLDRVFLECRFARVHGRFAFPVVFLRNDRFICRSGTISRGAEAMYRNISSRFKQSWGKWSLWGNNNADATTSTVSTTTPLPASLVMDADSCLSLLEESFSPVGSPTNSSVTSTNNKVGSSHDIDSADLRASFSTSQQRQWDCELLRRLKVGHIVDIMVENKKVKYGLTLCTSEKATKADSVYYAANNINIQVMPYPGREFFRFREYPADKQYQFRWEDAGLADAVFNVSNIDLQKYFPDIDFPNEYRKWDMLTITKNYLRLVLHMLADDADTPGGVLLHCLSGWDRTPLFISLLRISLWADNVVHQNLDTLEFLYLTLAYDWMLFCHQLRERLESNEEVMLFCFDFLQHITSDEFSYQRHRHNSAEGDANGNHDASTAASTSESASAPQQPSERARRLNELRELFVPQYRRIFESYKVEVLATSL